MSKMCPKTPPFCSNFAVITISTFYGEIESPKIQQFGRYHYFHPLEKKVPHFAAISPLSLFPPSIYRESPKMQQFRYYHYFHLYRKIVPHFAVILLLSLFPFSISTFFIYGNPLNAAILPLDPKWDNFYTLNDLSYSK